MFQPLNIVEQTSDELRRERDAFYDMFADTNEQLTRANILLRAARDILKTCAELPYTAYAPSITANYDGTTCDGYCLREDIEMFLEIDADEPVLNEGSK